MGGRPSEKSLPLFQDAVVPPGREVLRVENQIDESEDLFPNLKNSLSRP
jgi:hypothetical protein